MQPVSRKRTYVIADRLTLEVFQKFSEWHHEQYEIEPAGWISLEITSGGGSTITGSAIIDLVTRIRKGRIQTIGLGDVSSMAVPLFMVGEHRVVTPRTHFLIHEIGYTKESRQTISEIETTLADLLVEQQLYSEYIAERSNGKLSPEKVIQMMRANTHLRGAQAVELGIAHELIT